MITIIEKNRSYTSLSWDYYKRPIVIFWFRMYWCSSRQERETGIEKNQKIFSRTLLIKQWHAPILYKPKFLLLIPKRECQAREKFLLFFSMLQLICRAFWSNWYALKTFVPTSIFLHNAHEDFFHYQENIILIEFLMKKHFLRQNCCCIQEF